MSAMGVRTEVQLVDYVTAFLTHFGPQHLTIDVPVRLLCKCLPSMWPHTPTELAEKLAKLSPHFLVVNDVLFLSSNARHRRSLVDSLQLVNLSVQNLPKIFSMLLSNSHLHAHPNHIPPPSSLHPNISHHRRFAL
ncbi:hypothetical protein WR25_02869 [Diploscapter pachys]|uniref:Uncharacterized protein n=1 Tax=Diploscapter pachys TaxID=2018661 RepID=A0A2A2KPZ8_9BILA|nr:hypothetical protein WR25_02869 [Diploscapter pachys]